MPRVVKPFRLWLVAEEAALLRDWGSSGGMQALFRSLAASLNQDLSILLNDEEMGRLLRCMTQYGDGGWQSRLNKIFRRPVLLCLGWRV